MCQTEARRHFQPAVLEPRRREVGAADAERAAVHPAREDWVNLKQGAWVWIGLKRGAGVSPLRAGCRNAGLCTLLV